MNRLTLAQSLREKCGITGSGPSTTLSQTGEMLRVVNWIDEAWLQIQTLSDWWQWMRGDFSFDTIAAQREYVPSASPLSLTNFARWYTDPDHTWRAYLLSAGKATEQFLVEEPNYQVYRDTYLFGSEQSGPSGVLDQPGEQGDLAGALGRWHLPGLRLVPEGACGDDGRR